MGYVVGTITVPFALQAPERAIGKLPTGMCPSAFKQLSLSSRLGNWKVSLQSKIAPLWDMAPF